MSTLPANLSRVPDLLVSRISLAQLNRTGLESFRTQEQLTTGRRVNRPSDDLVAAAAIAVLDDRLARSEQRVRNLSAASLALGALDQAVGEATDIANEAHTVALSQAGSTSTGAERKAQAEVVSSLLQSLHDVANRTSSVGFVFGGDRTGTPPVVEFKGGFRFVGRGDGLVTDIGPGARVPVTGGGDNPVGETSRRHRGFVDLDPVLTTGTRLVDLNGARGLGINASGLMEVKLNGTSIAEVDVSHADTIGDVVDAIEAAIRAYESENGTTLLGAGGVTLSGGSIAFDFAPAPPGFAPMSLAFEDVGQGATAEDLGLTDGNGMTITPGDPDGIDLDPRLTWRTPIAALAALDGPPGRIRVNGAGESRIVDLSEAETLEDVRNAIEGLNLALRVRINDDGTGIDVLSELASTRDGAMSIEEVEGEGLTATALGIRTFAPETRLADFNDGRGVQIVSGVTDPVTGELDPEKNTDFRITLGDGREISVDLRPEDILTVQTLIERINAEAVSQGFTPAEFSAGLTDGANGLAFSQDPALAGPITVAQLNNSPAFGQLGLGGGVYDPSTSTFRADDRARVRVMNAFTNLLDLRASLETDDTSGITLAGEDLEVSIERLNLTRGIVGARAARVDDERRREEDRAVLDQAVRADFRDLDFTEAAVRFAQLQSQAQASLQALAASRSRSLLDFLG